MRKHMVMLMEAVSSTTTYWMREGNGKVVVCASSKTGRGVEEEKAKALERKVSELADMVGLKPHLMGSMVRSDGRGRVVVTGMAELPWTPRVEAELEHMGLVELK